MKRSFLIYTLLCCLPFPNLLAQQTLSTSIYHDGLQREYILYVPASYSSSDTVPLVFSFHGMGGTAQGQMEDHDFRPIADTAGFIIAHPQGVSNLGPAAWNIQGDSSAADDIGFTVAMIDSIAVDYNIDRDRIYSTGKSLGGFFSIHLAGQISNQIAAIASVSGTMTQNMLDSSNPLHPMPFLQIHGTTDFLVSYNGNAINYSVEDVLDFWVDFNNCDTIPSIAQVPDIDPNDGSTVEHIVYGLGDQGVTVEHFKVIGGGHTWPGSTSGQANTNFDINASEEIWQFFNRYDINGLVSGVVGIDEFDDLETPTFTLQSNYPNPFHSQTSFRFGLRKQGHVKLRVFDCQGHLVTTLVDKPMAAGAHVLTWNGTNSTSERVNSGVYFYRLETPDGSDTRIMILQN